MPSFVCWACVFRGSLRYSINWRAQSYVHSGRVRIQISWVLAVNWPIFNLISRSLQHQHTGCYIKIQCIKYIYIYVLLSNGFAVACNQSAEEQNRTAITKKEKEQRTAIKCDTLHIWSRRAETMICNRCGLHMNPGSGKQFEPLRCILGAVPGDGPEVVYHCSAGESLQTPPSAALKR